MSESAAPYVFVSYASADRERVLPVVAALERAGILVWIDREGIHGGANYGEEIAEAIRSATALVLMISAVSLASRNVKQEIALAWDFERPYIPLLLEPVAIPTDVRYWLTTAQWIEVLDTPEATWLPQVLTALAPLGITPSVGEQKAVNLPGRERELAVLRQKLSAAKEGQGGLVLIGGEAGIGKTTLAEAAMTEATQRGFVVLEGHCFDLAETPPYGPWIDLFARYEPSASSPPVPDAFAQRGTVGAVSNQMALFVQVRDFLKACVASRPEGARPVVVLLDDLHWSDPASLDLLRYLSRSVASLPLLLVVTYRSDELTRRHPLYALLPQLAREAGAARIDLDRLDAAAIRDLVRARYRLAEADADRLTAYLVERAEGNALFTVEVLRILEERGALRDDDGWRLGDLRETSVPTLLKQVIDARLARLGEEAVRALTAAAVIGQEVRLEIWAAVAEMGEDALLDVAERAEEARVLAGVPDGAGVRFTHALIREALYEGIPSIRQRRLHRKAGEALAATRSPDPDVVASHFQRAGEERALHWLLKAGERAQAAFAWVTAVARFEAALALMEQQRVFAEERGWLLYRLSRLLQYVEVPKARAFADEAVALAVAANDGALAAVAGYSRGLLAGYAGDAVSGLREMEAGVDALTRLTDTEWARITVHTSVGLPDEADRRGGLALFRALSGRYQEARELGDRIVAETVSPEEAPASSAAGTWALGEVYAALGMPEKAAAMLAIAYDAYHRAGDLVNVFNVSTRKIALVALPYRADDVAGRRRLADRAKDAFGRSSGAILPTILPRFVPLPLLVLEGQWQEAERIAAVISSEHAGVVAFRRQALRHVASLARLRGDAGRARSAVHNALPVAIATEPGALSNCLEAMEVQRVAAALCLDEGDLVTARAWLDAHDRWLAWSGAVLGQSEDQTLWAQYHRQAGDTEHAYAHARQALS